ncbi:MAG: hypothetical protein GTN70_00070 [Deltaproteobacteria bacterium]|nr:hypothetical protein [Deltaproteobacteria bacterium]NIS76055.1 hypothetical protein [Deltaproteobacteria bacterium]
MAFVVFFSQTLSLLLELSFFRFLSIQHFHQFASVTVGVVLAGYGFSGFLVYLMGTRHERFYRPGPYVLAFPVVLTASIVSLFLVKVEPSHLLVSPGKALLLFLLFLVFSLPYAVSGAIVGSAFASLPMSKFRVYALSMLGAGSGVLLWFPLSRAFPLKAILLLVILASTAMIFIERGRGVGKRTAVVLFSLAGAFSVFVKPQPLSEYKALSLFQKVEDSRVLGRSQDLAGEYLAGSSGSFHALPGLSPRYAGPVPAQIFAFFDGNLCGWSLLPRPEEYGDLIGYLPEMAAFLKEGGSALVAGYEGGVLQAMASRGGYGKVVVADGRKGLITLMSGAGQFDAGPAKVVAESPLRFIRSGTEEFDLIFLPEAGSLSYSMVYGKPLSEDYLFTEEVLGLAVRRLKEGGMLAFSGWSKSPLREEGKILNLLRRVFAPAPGETLLERVIVIYGYSRFIILASPGPFDPAFLGRLERFLARTGFPAIVTGRQVKGDYEDRQYVESLLAFLKEGDGRGKAHPFYLEVPTRDRPYFYRFFKPAGAARIYESLGRSSLVFFESGYLMLLLSLAVVAISGTFVILLPSLFVLRAYSREKPAGWGLLALGVLCGFGYTVVEMLLVGRASYFFDSYTEGFLVVIALFLTASGLGAIAGEKFLRGGGRVYLFVSLAVACLLFAVAVFPFLADSGVFAGRWLEKAVFAATSASIAFLLGLFLPPVLAGMQREVGPQGLVALWGINNFSSLLGSLVTPVITVTAGFIAGVAGASCLYLAFALLAKRRLA